MAKSITYATFAIWAKALAIGEEIEGYDALLFIEKADKLAEREANKADYSQKHKKPSVSKVSDATIANAEAILSVLSTEPMTTSEINEALGTDFEPLTVSNAIRYIERTTPIVKSKKVEAVTRMKNGVECTDQSPKTAYALAE